jgi:ADP-ribosylglycohydrolase
LSIILLAVTNNFERISMTLSSWPADYIERVYAGVLGKMIGVYLGRPFEGWTYEAITRQLGEITYYVHEKLGVPLIVTDDDLSGTFTFLRALPDYGNQRDLTPAQIGQTWLNYLIEKRTVLWWGGLGNSTEHTAYLRLKQGIPAPQSGSIALNGKVVAQQIGAQIFIDGWAMVAPGDPAFAADLARRAASVSHDGEAIYGAQVIAAMEALAFVEHDINALLDTALSFIPYDSLISRMIRDIREWHASDSDWHKTRARIATHYGYDTYGGNCHMVPNHALIILALLYGGGDFHTSLTIVNTAGWDTDCNSGNVGCLLGIRNGLQGLMGGPDWRGPVADRLYLPTADGGRAITDAVTETYHIVNIARALLGEQPLAPKQGARFHFELPGSVQGFQVENAPASLENVAGQSRYGERSLAVHYDHLSPEQPLQVTTPTFIPPDMIKAGGYGLLASPTLYSGQTLRASVSADRMNSSPVNCRLILYHYGEHNQLVPLQGPEKVLHPGKEEEFSWHVPQTGGEPIAAVGIALSTQEQTHGSVYLDFLTWDGTPELVLTRPRNGSSVWQRAWINGMDQFSERSPEPLRLIQNYGRGLLIQGTREWSDYQASAALTPHMVQATGLAIRAQGMQRYYALLLSPNQRIRLVKVLDGEQTLVDLPFAWETGQTYTLRLQAVGTQVQGWINGQPVGSFQDRENPLTTGGIALICEEGRVGCDEVSVQPVS